MKDDFNIKFDYKLNKQLQMIYFNETEWAWEDITEFAENCSLIPTEQEDTYSGTICGISDLYKKWIFSLRDVEWACPSNLSCEVKGEVK